MTTMPAGSCWMALAPEQYNRKISADLFSKENAMMLRARHDQILACRSFRFAL